MTAYLDHAATTPMRPEVVDAMLPFLTDRFGNPTGAHAVGRAARQAVDEARERAAAALGADPAEIVFTSGGTESDNLAVTGSHRVLGGTVVSSSIEHHAVLRCVEGVGGRLCPVTVDGVIDIEALDALLDDSVTLVSVMLVNNETGVIQPLHKVKRVMEKRSPRAVLHTDAVQAVPWLDVAGMARFADLVSVSAHKFGGPQGVGALVARKGTRLAPLLQGGGQERERRSGTQNVAGIVGMFVALEAAVAEREQVVARVAPLRDRLVDGLLAAGDATETGARSAKTANNAHVRFAGIESEALLVLLDEGGVCASSGASCSSGAMEPSHVLLAMGMTEAEASSSIRMTLGPTTTDHDIDVALKVVPDAVSRLREE